MKINLICAILLCLSASPVVLAQQPTEVAVDKTAEIAEVIKAFQEKHRIPGLSVAVIHNDQLVFDKGFGQSDLENNVPATHQTVYRTASIAKSMTATAILQLIDSGQIGIDDSIRKHCPEFPDMATPPTIRQLLCHQGGIRHYKTRNEPNGTEAFYSLADTLKLFVNDDLVATPGTKYSYTTFGYTLLGRAIETASGTSYREYMDENVFEPANMNSTGLDDVYRIIPNRSRGYAKLNPVVRRSRPADFQGITESHGIYNCPLHDTSMKIPGGGIVSTAGDLVRFGQAMLNNKLMKPATREMAWTAQSTNTGTASGYGLGWNVRSFEREKFISHSGGQSGTSTFLSILPKRKLCIAVMANLQRTPCAQLDFDIRKIFTRSDSP